MMMEVFQKIIPMLIKRVISQRYGPMDTGIQQGLVVTKEGLVIAHEHGPKGGDELNIIHTWKELWMACHHLWG